MPWISQLVQTDVMYTKDHCENTAYTPVTWHWYCALAASVAGKPKPKPSLCPAAVPDKLCARRAASVTNATAPASPALQSYCCHLTSPKFQDAVLSVRCKCQLSCFFLQICKLKAKAFEQNDSFLMHRSSLIVVHSIKENRARHLSMYNNLPV